MPRRRYTPEEIIGRLREAEVLLSHPGRRARPVANRLARPHARALAISEQACYRWRKDYGALRTEQAQRLNALEQENGRVSGDGLGGEGSVPGSPLCPLVSQDLAERGNKHVLAVPATLCVSQQEG